MYIGRNNTHNETSTQNTLIIQQNLKNQEDKHKKNKLKKLIRTKQGTKDVVKGYVFHIRNVYR
jgi:hypothetical protein